MDYEKKYKEALEKLRSLHDNYDTVSTLIDIKEELEQIFPELCESEDERIRKGIKSILEHYKESGEVVCPYPFVSIDEALAWLEKQGTSYTKKDVDDALVEGMAFAKNELKKQGEQKPTDEDMKEALRTEYEKGRADAFAQMQKEWSEEDKDFMYDTLSNLTELKDRYGEGYGNVGRCIDWVKDLKNRVQPQPKQEWSEEDEIGLTNTMIMIKEVASNHYTKDSIDFVVNWLQSLKERYAWKPSDEQMHAFEQVYDWYNNNFAPSETLTSLYKDLEKLKGE